MAKIGCVKAEKFEMEYISFGNGKKVFVMIPGLSVGSIIPSADAIESAYEQFCEEYTIYLFDRKKQIENDYSIEEMADDTYEAIRLLGLKDIYLFGVSLGGMIAQTIAVKYPDIINAMIIASSASRVTDFISSRIGSWVALASKNEKETLARSMVHDIYSEETVLKYGEILTEQISNASDYEIDRFVKTANAVFSFDVYEELDEINVPTLVIGSKKDNVLSASASIDIAEKMGCELYLYDGYSHAVYDEAQDYKSRIKQFFDRY